MQHNRQEEEERRGEGNNGIYGRTPTGVDHVNIGHVKILTVAGVAHHEIRCQRVVITLTTDEGMTNDEQEGERLFWYGAVRIGSQVGRQLSIIISYDMPIIER